MGVDILGNWHTALDLLRSSGRDVGNLVTFLEKNAFYEAECTRYSAGRGGALNHSLWTLLIARNEREKFLSANPDADIPEDSLVLLCLLHCVCDCPNLNVQERKKPTGGGRRSEEILRAAGAPLSEGELLVIRGAYSERMEQTVDNVDVKYQLLHYLLYCSSKRAGDYATGIPFGSVQSEPASMARVDRSVEVVFNAGDHRTYQSTGASGTTFTRQSDADDESMVQMTVRQLCTVRLDAEDAFSAVSVLSDDYGTRAVLTAMSADGDGCLLCSDRACFDYRRLVLFVSRFPEFRASYLVAQRQNGKWGVFSLKYQKFREPLIKCSKIVDFDSRSMEEAMSGMYYDAGHRFRICLANGFFYTKISVS